MVGWYSTAGVEKIWPEVVEQDPLPPLPKAWTVEVNYVRHIIATFDPAVPYRLAIAPVATCCGLALVFSGQAEVAVPTCPQALSEALEEAEQRAEAESPDGEKTEGPA